MQARHEVGAESQVMHGESQETHIPLKPIKGEGQFLVHALLKKKYSLEHETQFVIVPEQESQLESQSLQRPFTTNCEVEH